MTLQLMACLARMQLLAACSRESPVRFSHESLFFLHTLEHFFTLSHSLSLQESHLNTRLLIVEIQANWHEIKPTRWLIKFNLTLFPLFLSLLVYWLVSFVFACTHMERGCLELGHGLPSASKKGVDASLWLNQVAVFNRFRSLAFPFGCVLF